jgi:hypothetical protein
MSEPGPSKFDKNTRPRWTAGAVAVFALGLLIFIPSGLCTGIIGVLSLFDSATDFGEFLVIVLPVGGLPMVIGAALVYAGLKLRRRD